MNILDLIEQLELVSEESGDLADVAVLTSDGHYHNVDEVVYDEEIGMVVVKLSD